MSFINRSVVNDMEGGGGHHTRWHVFIITILFGFMCVYLSHSSPSHETSENVDVGLVVLAVRRELQRDTGTHNVGDSEGNNNSVHNMCRKMKKKHNVEVGKNWGTLTLELQTLWNTLFCNELFTEKGSQVDGGHADASFRAAVVEEGHHAVNPHHSVHGSHVTDDYVKEFDFPAIAVATATAVVETKKKMKKSVEWKPVPSRSQPAIINVNEKSLRGKRTISHQNFNSLMRDNGGADPSSPVKETVEHEAPLEDKDTALPNIKVEDSMWCFENKKKFKVIPQKSWGSLPASYIDQWKSRRCDMSFTVARMKGSSVTRCEDVESNYRNADKLPLISILAASTTRKMIKPSVKRMSLFTYLLPSLIRTIDCGFRYEYVLGYDAGDPFFDSTEGIATVDKWFMENIVKPMGKNGVMILPLKKVRVNNSVKKPGPVFLEMARAAYEGGADYMYRVNDDTELIDKWPNAFVKALHSIPGQVGVVGPTCTQGNVGILTHDFVARVHMDIMQMNYYPPQLVDWWMDDWISFVYGSQRSFKAASVRVVHHTGAHGQRYVVDRANFQTLGRLLKEGRSLIRNHLLRSGVTDGVIQSFDKDGSTTFVHKNAPN